MTSLNKWQGIGRLGKDPEVRNLDNGSMVASFSIACSESWRDKATGEKKESTEWVNCVAWRHVADVASKYVRKGDLVYIDGRLKTRSYEKDNVTRYLTEVVADNIIMLSSKPKPNPVAMESSGHLTPEINGNTADDLPF